MTTESPARSLTSPLAREARRIDLTGQVFGKLTALEPVHNGATSQHTPQGVTRWRCRCECGAIVVAATRDLRSKHTRSCGCLRVSAGRATFEKLRKMREALT